MGWFDDNHPNGQAAEDEMMEMFGPGKWQKDTPKASGSSSRTTKRIERPGAEWGQLYFDSVCAVTSLTSSRCSQILANGEGAISVSIPVIF